MTRSRARTRRSPLSGPIAGAFALVCVLGLFQLVRPGFFPSVFSAIFGLIWSGANSAGLDVTSKAYLAQQNAELEQELALYQAEASSTDALLTENAELKALLGRSDAAKAVTLASVVKRPPGGGYDYLILDIGSSSGVQVGDPVYAAGQALIGQIDQVQGATSRAELYSTPGVRYDVLIGPNHVPAEAVGQGGGSIAAPVSREAGVQVGDPVIIPDISSSNFGTVGAVVSDPSQPFAQVIFQSPVNVFTLRWALVGTGLPVKKALSTSTAATSSAASATSTRR